VVSAAQKAVKQKTRQKQKGLSSKEEKMKKLIVVLTIMVAIAFIALPVMAEKAVHDDPAKVMGLQTSAYPKDAGVGVGQASGATSVEVVNGMAKVTMANPLLTPFGDTKGKGLVPAVEVAFGSGLLDAKHGKGKAYFYKGQVVNNTLTVIYPNPAIQAGQPVAEHHWGRGKSASGTSLYLVHDPNDIWVVYELNKDGSPNLNTLAIGIVYFPDGRVIPLKSLGLGKIKQGVHPELAGK